MLWATGAQGLVGTHGEALSGMKAIQVVRYRRSADLERWVIEDHRRLLPRIMELALEVLLVLQQCEWT